MGFSEGNGMPQSLIVLIHNLYYGQEATVRTEYKDRMVSYRKGVRHWCILSPYLLNLYAEHSM